MWAAQPAPERGISPSFIIGLVLLLFIMTADMSSWGTSNSSGAQQVRLGQQSAHAQAQEVRDKLLYELSVSNERLEEENRHLRTKVLYLRAKLREHRGNGTSAGSTSEAIQAAQSEAAATEAGQRSERASDKLGDAGSRTMK